MSVFIKFELMGRQVIVAEVPGLLYELMLDRAPAIPYRTLAADGDAANKEYLPEVGMIGWGAIHHTTYCSEAEAKEWSRNQREARPFQPTAEWCRAAGWKEEIIAKLSEVLEAWPSGVTQTSTQVYWVCRRVSDGADLASLIKSLEEELPF